MAKLVINRCYGGFSLSEEAVILARKLSDNPKWGGVCIIGDEYPSGEVMKKSYGTSHIDKTIERHDPILVQVVEQLGSDKASGQCARLVLEELESGTLYNITEYDGMERIEIADNYQWSIMP